MNQPGVSMECHFVAIFSTVFALGTFKQIETLSPHRMNHNVFSQKQWIGIGLGQILETVGPPYDSPRNHPPTWRIIPFSFSS